MGPEDIEAIADRLFVNLNHPQNAASKPDVIDVIKNMPEKLYDLLFPVVDEYITRKLLESDGPMTMVINDTTQVYDAIIESLRKKLGASPAAA
jgi:hypothetical protein